MLELEEQVIERLVTDIGQASGHEIFLIGEIDRDNGRIVDYNILARGNDNMVPAIITDLRPGTILIHNHPSGDLTPSANDIHIAARIGNRGIGFAIIDNAVENIYIVVEPRIPEEEQLLEEDELIQLFEPRGNLAEILTDYEYREEQLSVVKEVIISFNNHQNTIIEAGTGTGKSFAYLIPAIYWAKNNKQPVVISTNTINLQEQLIKKDLITLKIIMPFSFKTVLVKGRGNYICKRKLNIVESSLNQENELNKDKEDIIKILNWIDKTDMGTRSDLKFVVKNNLWEEIASESGMCLNAHCAYFNSCFFMEARKEIYSADILVVNHHLLLSDANLKKENSSILPDYKHLVIDESHNFHHVATYHLGIPFYQKLVRKFLERLNEHSYSVIPALRNQLGKIIEDDKREYYNKIDNEIIPIVKNIEDLYQDYFRQLENLLDKKGKKKLRITSEVLTTAEWEDLQQTGQRLEGFINNLGLNLNQLYQLLIAEGESLLKNMEERIIELEAAIRKCNKIYRALNFNLEAEVEDYVFWLEKDNRVSGSQRNAPLNVADLLPDLLWDGLDNLVLTSATMTVNNSFQFFQNLLGLNESRSLKIESPFDYSKQVRVIIPDDIPPANSSRFLPEIISDFEQILRNYGGSAMVLFTSYNMLNYCLEQTEGNLNKAGINILPQGRYPRHQIIKDFKEKKNQIIFGTVSFWEGIDIKGNDLNYLIIMKLPFPVPDEPVAAARRELMKKRGENAFYKHSLPRAVIRFKQGFGRLIRSRQDKGIVLVFDNRLLDKSYGEIFLNSLPAGCQVEIGKIKDLLDIKLWEE